MAIPQDRELLHAIPQEYRVDKADGIRDPVGMIGTRLETEMYLVTIGSSPAMNLRKAIERAGYKTRELVLESLASALSVLTDEEKELGVVLVELGAGTTDLAIFTKARFVISAPSRLAGTTSPAISCRVGHHAERRRTAQGSVRLRLRAAGRSGAGDRDARVRISW